jgi:hypothetical protein
LMLQFLHVLQLCRIHRGTYKPIRFAMLSKSWLMHSHWLNLPFNKSFFAFQNSFLFFCYFFLNCYTRKLFLGTNSFADLFFRLMWTHTTHVYTCNAWMNMNLNIHYILYIESITSFPTYYTIPAFKWVDIS